MARKSSEDGVNKSQAIRDLLTENPKITPREIIENLAQKGIEVKPSLIYIVKGKLQEKKRRARRDEKAVSRASAGGKNDAVATIMKVRKLAEEVGGMRSLRAIVEALDQ